MKTNNIITALVLNSAIAFGMTTGVQAAGKTLQFGDEFLGATLVANMSYYVPPQRGSCDFYTSARATGMVLYDSYHLASGSANFRVTAGTTGSRAWGYLQVGSATIVKWDKTATGTANFSTAPQAQEWTAGFDFLGVLGVEAGISASISAEGKVTCSSNRLIGRPKGYVPPTVVTASFGPSADVAVIGRGYIDLGVAWGGLYGKVSLCKLGLNAKATMTPSTIPTELNTSIVNYAMTFRAETLSGSLTAWQKNYIPFVDDGEDTWSWTGLVYTHNLGSGTFKLKKAPIVLLN